MTRGERDQPDDHFSDPRLACFYDLTCGWSEDRDYYLSLADRGPLDILDLGCGTGLLCAAFAERGHRVVGVDPARAMLDLARGRRQGDRVEWVQAFAQDYESGRCFDLITMTGHAFQVLLEDEDVAAACRLARRQLRPDGRFVFETRNPAVDWARQWHGRMSTWTLDDGARLQQRTEVLAKTERSLRFRHDFEFRQQVASSESRLRFFDRRELEERLGEAGLRVDTLHGDWGGAAFDEASSRELIVHAAPID